MIKNLVVDEIIVTFDPYCALGDLERSPWHIQQISLRHHQLLVSWATVVTMRFSY